MAQSKYDKYFLTEPGLRRPWANPKLAKPKAVMQSGPHFGSGNFSVAWECVYEPMTMDPVAHTHDFDEYISFMGSNADNLFDFDAEIEIFVGEEGEKHIINKATVFYVPAGLVHCPIVYKRIRKPILFNIMAFTKQYYDLIGAKKFFVRKGQREKAIADLKKIVELRVNPASADTAKAFLKTMEANKEIGK
jgi:hypothetical protein